MTDHKQKALNALAKGAAVTTIGLLISKALTYLYRISIARFLGPEAYGQLSLAIMVVSLGSTIAYLSMGQALRKFIPEYRTDNDRARIKGTVLSVIQISLPLSLIAWSITFFGAEFISLEIFQNKSLIPLIEVMSFTIIIGVFTRTFLDTTLGFNKIIYKTATSRIIKNIAQLGVTVTLLALGYDVISAAWGSVTSVVLAMILAFYFLERKVGPILLSDIKPKYNRKKVIRYSSPLVLSGLIATFMGYADTGLLGYYMTDFEVGLYNAALPTAMLILLPHKAIGSLALSSLSELKEKDEESVQESLQTATKWVFSLVLPTFLILLLFSEQVLTIMWGGRYTAASLSLAILGCGYLIDAMVGKVGSYLASESYTKYILYNNIAALSLNLILNLLLIPIYGMIGAAIATASSTILTNLLMVIEAWRKENVITIPYKAVAKIAFTGLIPLILILGLDTFLFTNTPYWFLAPAAATYGLIYIALYLKILGLGKEEREVFRRIGEITGYREEIERVLEMIEEYF